MRENWQWGKINGAFIETNADLQEEFYSFTNVCLEPMEDSELEKSDLYMVRIIQIEKTISLDW